MKALKLLIIFLYLINATVLSQTKNTKGANSPIVGAKAKVEYISNNSVKLSVSPAMATYLTGLLLANKVKSDTAAMNAAITAWVKKYKELKIAVNNVNDIVKRNMLLQKLDQGEFLTVEKNLAIKTSYAGLSKIFPATYQTTGDQSPIVSDFATVTYVVNEVINIGLDETIVQNIMNELKSKEQTLEDQKNKMNSLTIDIPSVGKTVNNYITSYKLVKAELRKTPAAVFKRANIYFVKGNFKRVIEILDSSLKHNSKSYGKINLLKAKISLLTFDYNSIDSIINEINKFFSIGVLEIPTADNQIEYGKFLIDYMNNYQGAIPYLEKNLDSVKNIIKKVELYNYISLAYSQVDRIKSVSFLEKGLDLIMTKEPITDSIALEQKSNLLYNLARAYSSTLKRERQLKAIMYMDMAIETNDKITNFAENERYKKALYLNENGKQCAQIGDSTGAYMYYQKSKALFDKLYEEKPNRYCFYLSYLDYNLSQHFFNLGNYDSAIYFLEEARNLIEPRASLNRRSFVNLNMQIYTALATNFTTQKKTDSLISILKRLSNFIIPFVSADSNNFRYLQVVIHTDLGELYLMSDKPDTARFYILDSYNYFIEHINSIQFDKFKVSKCLYIRNSLYIKNKEFNNARAYNEMLMAKFNSLIDINRFNYEDFIPQINSQLAEIFLAELQYDSAILFSNKSLADIEPRARQYGISFLGQQNTYMRQACNIRLAKNDFDEADSLALSYIENLSIQNTIDPFVKNQYQGEVGDLIVNLTNTFILFSDTASNASDKINRCKFLYPKVEKYFDLAESHYKIALEKNKNDTFRYAQYMLNYYDFISSYSGLNDLDVRTRELLLTKGCYLLKKAGTMLQKLPNNNLTTPLKDKVVKGAVNCL